ncbi:hypothetical protein Zmor_013516 [Zophobas morio]|uniref:28S ribosomal protein S22, mitochondrial n=1 Tax=Zophobas morio TaxID=2755281 RepID=A0AA38MFM1_9CUCU|nr:hypothetical protein Zmor_013516 [Zophobas morio]
MSVFRHFSRKLVLNTFKSDIKLQINTHCSVCLRFLSYQPIHYDGKPDPGPVFIKKEVQTLLRTLTRVDLAKVFKKRRFGETQLQQPVYKFMTDEQLQEAYEEAKKKVDTFLQIPPVVAVRKPKDKVLSKDPALQGLDTSAFVFTDISYGVRDSERMILVRETDGTLREADWETRDRINQLYFPVAQRQIQTPKMFQDSNLEDLLKRGEYNFILDRACLQFDPNDPLYQKIVSITYQCVNDNNHFNELRSTRHFGSFVFFLAWNKLIDNLLLDIIESEHIEEAKALVELYSHIHQVKYESKENLQQIDEYIKNHASKKAALELAFQAYKNAAKRKGEVEEGIKRAHGLS